MDVHYINLNYFNKRVREKSYLVEKSEDCEFFIDNSKKSLLTSWNEIIIIQNTQYKKFKIFI